MTRSLILASQSPARLQLLRAAGINPEVLASGADETIDPYLAPDIATVALAKRKARAVSELTHPQREALVLGCDSMLWFDGRTHGKPGTADAARTAWQQRRGKTGVLWTGHVLIDLRSQRLQERAIATTVHFANLNDSEIDAYVASGEPLSVAGAFTLDGRGAPFIERIEGDHSNVVGLSLPALRHMLFAFGIALHELWR